MPWLLQTAIDRRWFKFQSRAWLRKLARCWRGHFVRSVYGPLLKVDFDDFTNFASIAGILAIDYENVFAEVEKLGPGECFIDVGANTGVFALAAASRLGPGGAVLAFEPNLEIFADLTANILANQARTVFALNAALGGATGLARFWGGVRHHTGVGHLGERGDRVVMQYGFDQSRALFDAAIGARRTTIKIDVEGAEHVVIQSMREFLARGQAALVIVEIDATYLARFGDQPAALYDTMAQLGYRPRHGLGFGDHYNEFFERAS